MTRQFMVLIESDTPFSPEVIAELIRRCLPNATVRVQQVGSRQ